MLIFDEIKKNDPQLRFLALVLAGGFFVLLVGLWWVQIVTTSKYQSNLETQSYRTIRIPGMRGKILDREGRVLAENSPRYNLSLYFGGLSSEFQAEYDRLRPVRVGAKTRPVWEFWTGSPRAVRKIVPLSASEIYRLRWQARYDVVEKIVNQMSQTLGQPLTFDYKSFFRAYESSLYVPYPIAQGMDPEEVARFEENYSGQMGVDLDVQPTRVYPYGATAADVLGYVVKDDTGGDEDEAYNYCLPDYRGVVGVEGGYNDDLHGQPGVELVMVNNLGYRQAETIGNEPAPGHNLVLTIDLDIQQAAEKALAAHQGENVRAAIIVMNVHTGDILAMVSSPALDPNYFTRNLSPDEMAKETALMEDTNLMPQINFATYAAYEPGSIFKPIVGLAALEDGLNPHEIYQVQADPENPDHGCIYIGKHHHKIRDTVPPGDYDFKRAIELSSNSYFIFMGLRTGIQRVVAMAEKFHFGEKTGLKTRQDAPGIFPSMSEVEEPDWRDGDTANICFGQGRMAVTPIQMAVAYCAIANGGTVLWPRLVDRIESQDPDSGEAPTIFPSGLARDHLNVHARSLHIIQDAMLGETEEGTGRPADVAGLQICGKTGTAQIQNEKGQLVAHNYWFASFAPYSDPKYAVIVMVHKPMPLGGSGGLVCAPIAHDIYTELVKKDPTIVENATVRN